MGSKSSPLYGAGKRGGTGRRAENERIEVLFFNYKLGKQGADTALMEGMWPYIEPIYRTIIHGTWYEVENRIWVQFIEHYLGHKINHTRNQKLLGEDSNYESYIDKGIKYVQRLLKGVSKDELRHIMRIAIFELARTYRHRGTPNFLLYFSMYYTHRLQSYIKPLINDYMYYGTMMGKREPLRHELLLEEPDYRVSESYMEWYNLLYTGNTIDEIDRNWVIGYTGELFENLSRHDRLLLKWRYVDDISVMAIGERLGLSRTNVWRRMNKILDKLRGNLAAKHLLGGETHGSIVNGANDPTGKPGGNTEPQDHTM
jgi:hypothetical protein